MKVSFDFDGCLGDCKKIQSIARVLLDDKKNEVFILTSRYDNENNKLRNKIVHEVAKEFGIKNNNIIFTGSENKVDFIEKLSIDIHFDDDIIDVDQINHRFPNTALWVGGNMMDVGR